MTSRMKACIRLHHKMQTRYLQLEDALLDDQMLLCLHKMNGFNHKSDTTHLRCLYSRTKKLKLNNR